MVKKDLRHLKTATERRHFHVENLTFSDKKHTNKRIIITTETKSFCTLHRMKRHIFLLIV